MPPFTLMHTIFYFLLALAILVAFHEFGHYYACRKLGVKVLRFSIGMGQSLWRYRKTPDDTEFSIGLLPLGGYVKMADEREGEVSAQDLPYAFNRQPLWVRSAIVFAGPLANFLLAVLLYWLVFMIGETGVRPLVGVVPPDTLAAAAGFLEGDEIIKVGDADTPTWGLAFGEIMEQAVDQESVTVTVRTQRDAEAQRQLNIPLALVEKPDELHQRLGLQPLEPVLEPVVDKIEPGSVAAKAGLVSGDRLLTADGKPVKDWKHWVEYVRASPGKAIQLTLERGGKAMALSITPATVASKDGTIGRIGAAPKVPESVAESLRVEYRLGPFQALTTAVAKTWDYSVMTLKMIGRMVVGKASVENLSGPISIAQYAGQSASLGLVQFLKFLAIVSVSLCVLNLLPIPVLDGGHLFFYGLEALRGEPVPEKMQLFLQNIGIVILLTLMVFSFYLDIFRHPA